MSEMEVLPDVLEEARQKVEQMLGGPYVLFFVFGNDGDSDRLADVADFYGKNVDGWRVVRARESVISRELRVLLSGRPDPNQLLQHVELDQVVAIVTSHDDEIRAVMKTPYSALTNSTIRRAWYLGAGS